MKEAKKYIEELELKPHVEGGYYKEILKSQDTIQYNGKNRSLYTSILFLLEKNNVSNFHELTADEIWYFHDGMPLTIHMITKEGKYHTVKLGRNSSENEVLQYVVEKGTIFGSDVEEGYALVSCAVVPGFEFDDFKLFERSELLNRFPQHKEIIVKLTRQ